MNFSDEELAELEERRRRREESVRGLTFVRQPYSAEDMLIVRKPNEAGYYASFPYHGGPFDETRFRLVRGGWDHDHCYICVATINPGDEWWAAEPPDELAYAWPAMNGYLAREPDEITSG